MTKILVRFVKFRMTDNLEIHKVKERIKMTKLFNCSTIRRVKAYAFTLAETLIVIGIIGVVAALTLPNLNHATGDKEKVTKVKKIYASLTEAFDRAQAIYGDADTWFNDCGEWAECNERAAKRITEFMKVSKDCGFDTDKGCFSSAPLLDSDGEAVEDNGSFFEFLDNAYYMVMLADGIAVSLLYNGERMRIRVDIDGPNKGKNQEGNDIFDFSAYTAYDNLAGMKKNILYPSGWPIYWTGQSALWYQTAWVIENGNLDYLKCPDELNWETKTSCE